MLSPFALKIGVQGPKDSRNGICSLFRICAKTVAPPIIANWVANIPTPPVAPVMRDLLPIKPEAASME